MKIDGRFLDSRVARRILALFVVCALAPIIALSLISFRFVTHQFESQSRQRLHLVAKSVSMGLLQRLATAETELKSLAARGASAGTDSFVSSENFSGVVVLRGSEARQVFGRIDEIPNWNASDREHLSAGGTLLSLGAGIEQPKIFLGLQLDPADSGRGMLLAELRPSFLWAPDNAPQVGGLFVLDSRNRVLFGSLPASSEFRDALLKTPDGGSSRELRWKDDDTEYLGHYWSVFLKQRYGESSWRTVVAESKIDLLAPLGRFRIVLSLVVLLSLSIVLFLSMIQIRRSLVPLRKLQEATRRVAANEFDSRVRISSGDEFEQLGDSFNLMARRLGRQFRMLTAMAEIDRAILSTLDREKIVETVLARIPGLFGCDVVAVTLLDRIGGTTGRNLVRVGSVDTTTDVELTDGDVRALTEGETDALVFTHEDVPGYLHSLRDAGTKHFRVMPVLIQHSLAGAVTLGYRRPPEEEGQDEWAEARQLVNQVAIALSKANLVDELEENNWQTLRALARAIDAKSPWTAGHSTRVTRVALDIAREMGLPEADLKVIHRGGLLHDIGKIGVPNRILEKPDKLTDEEMKIIQTHPEVGARILEPLEAYAAELPIVLYHHEKWDGTGYPEGLAEESIPLKARILAVADVHDALNCDRPYRAGWAPDRVINYIRKQSESHFDPQVVEAFLRMIERRQESVANEREQEEAREAIRA